jgi:hypothetical protein
VIVEGHSNGGGRGTIVEESDIAWAQNVVDRWSVKTAVPAPSVTTISTSKEITLSAYQNSTIIVSEKAWDRQNLSGKLLLLANPFGYHVQSFSNTKHNDERAWELIRELVVLEVELWSDATGVKMAQLMKIKTIKNLMCLLAARPAARW